MNKLLWIALTAGLLVILGIYGYNKWTASAAGDEISIPKDSAESLKVDIDFGVGNLLIHGGSSDWVSGEFTYNHKKLEPKVSYKNRKNVGHVAVKQGSYTMFGFNKRKSTKNDWDLQLNNDIPIDLNVDMGVSDSTLNLKGIQLNSLVIDSGVSNSTIDLSGDWKKGFRANVDLGVGDVTFILPKDTGVRLTVSKGLGTLGMKDLIKQSDGTYVNEAYGKSDVVIDISVNFGVGDVEFKIAD
ncbi:toast rack family protein [Sporosarcina highlanderae]|uniref:Toast rack family protein n=1 Tax=Sporosarcina highlanderae TaxID=3035916 RepID=A0ABT8JNS7_9BACL|nr:toast rack family protein [Sporosarcina highlanderae]MDN4606607.1 toast rack family protein [Sporosarcina highlanderae]